MKKLIIGLTTASLLAAMLCGCVLGASATDDTAGRDLSQKEQTDTQTPAAPDTQPDAEGAPADAAPAPTEPETKRDAIPFEEGQLYAAAYLGFQSIEDWDYYAAQYLDDAELPVHYVSDGDYYLVIPRYDGTSAKLYVNDIETDEQRLIFEDPDCGPFLIQCNISDIFSDATVILEHGGESGEFTPFISLENGQPSMGDRGLDITKPTEADVTAE